MAVSMNLTTEGKQIIASTLKAELPIARLVGVNNGMTNVNPVLSQADYMAQSSDQLGTSHTVKWSAGVTDALVSTNNVNSDPIMWACYGNKTYYVYLGKQASTGSDFIIGGKVEASVGAGLTAPFSHLVRNIQVNIG